MMMPRLPTVLMVFYLALPGLFAMKSRLGLFNHEAKALVDAAFGLVPGDADATDVASVGNVSAAVGLDVKAIDVDYADLGDALGQEVDLRPDQVGVDESSIARREAHADVARGVDRVLRVDL